MESQETTFPLYLLPGEAGTSIPSATSVSVDALSVVLGSIISWMEAVFGQKGSTKHPPNLHTQMPLSSSWTLSLWALFLRTPMGHLRFPQNRTDDTSTSVSAHEKVLVVRLIVFIREMLTVPLTTGEGDAVTLAFDTHKLARCVKVFVTSHTMTTLTEWAKVLQQGAAFSKLSQAYVELADQLVQQLK